MSFYGYPNARLRARKDSLFNKEFFERLLKSKGTRDVVTALTEAGYKKDIEKGLVKHPGILGLEEGLKFHLINTFLEIRHLLNNNKQGGKLISLILARFDLHNIKTILRGFHSAVPKEEIKEDLIPVGDLDQTLLNDLTNQMTLKACIDQLLIFKIPYAKPLIQEYAEYMKTYNLAILELALDRFYYNYIFKGTKGFSKSAKLVRELVQRDIDTTNIMTLLRLKREAPFLQKLFGDKQEEELLSKEKKKPKLIGILIGKPLRGIKKAFNKAGQWLRKRRITKEKEQIYIASSPEQTSTKKSFLRRFLLLDFFSEKFGRIKKRLKTKKSKAENKVEEKREQWRDYFIEGGKEISKEKFLKLVRLGKVEKIVEELKRSNYYKPLKEGMKKYLITGSLAALERRLEDYNIKKTINLFREDPLSIGIVIAYAWSKYNEVINLRIIIRGKEVEMPEKEIKEALVLV